MTDAVYSAAPFAVTDDDSAVRLVLARVRLYARRRLAWLNSLILSGNGAPIDARAGEMARLLDDADDPAAEMRWIMARGGDLNEAVAHIDAALAADHTSRLAQLITTFALDAAHIDVLHVCLAVSCEPALGRLCAYLHDDGSRAYPTLTLAARLFNAGRVASWHGEHPLRRWRMVRVSDAPNTPPELAPIMLDPMIRDWLCGGDELDAELVGRGRLALPLEPLADWEIDSAARFAARALEEQPGRTVIFHLIAPPGSGRRTYAANIARALGMPLLAIETAAIPDHEWETAFIHAQRHGFLHRCALAWVLTPETAARRWSNDNAHFPVQFIIRDAFDTPPVITSAIEQRIVVPVPDSAARWRLWSQYAPAACAADREAMIRLAVRLNARPAAIADAARIPDASPDAMAAALRASRRELLGALAQPLACPFVPDDLVIGDSLRAALDDLMFEAAERGAFWEQPEAQRLFPQGRGLAALFAGAPGTGKTMAAQVIAAQVGLDLFRIDLSQVVSKYIGETASNLQRILSRASGMDVILFFDEADALFSRRTDVRDAHDRYANTDTDHLLQALESYDGIALLATNRKANIDPAFVRRLRYVLEFPKPDAEQRWHIWMRVIDGLAGSESAARLRPFLRRLASEQDVTGAQIKYAALSALFAARREGTALQADHLVRGLDRELNKEGRALSDRERAHLGAS